MDLFKFKENQTTAGREITAGAVTFMAMAYIIFVNPKILAAAMGEELVPALGEQAGFLDPKGQMPRLKNILLVDSLAALSGGLFGCSSVTTYMERAAGVGEGGRTGMTAVVVGILFLLAIFFTPLVAVVPAYATAPALILVGFLLMSGVRAIAWDDAGTALPVFLTVVMIPFTFSISKKIGCGFISYVLLKLLGGKFREIHPLMALVSLLFAVDFYLA